MDGGDIYLHHKSLSNLLLLIKCILYLPTGAALSSNGSVGCSTNKSSPVAFGFRGTLLLRRRVPFANRGPEQQHVKPSKTTLQIHSILQCREKMKYWPTISWLLVPTAVHRIPMLIGSWRANSLFVLRPRAVYFLSLGLLLNYRFVFSSTSSFQKAGVLRRPRLLMPEPNPETRRPSKGRGPKTSTDLAETEQGRRIAHRCTARVSQPKHCRNPK